MQLRCQVTWLWPQMGFPWGSPGDAESSVYILPHLNLKEKTGLCLSTDSRALELLITAVGIPFEQSTYSAKLCLLLVVCTCTATMTSLSPTDPNLMLA